MSKVWLITGSSRGLGRALAEAVLAAGHKLVATARSLRLLLGSAAAHAAEQAELARMEADRKRRGLSESTDFAGVPIVDLAS